VLPPPSRNRRLAGALLTAAGVLSALGLTGCRSTSSTAALPDDGRPNVVAAFYPLAYAAKQVGGDAVQVTSLTPPGLEPHDLELSAAQVAQIAAADVVLYVKGFQPAVDEAIAQQAADRAIDVSAGLDLIPGDPHVWLDPANMAAIGSTIATTLADVDPQDASTIAEQGTAFAAAMTALDDQYATGLATCASHDLVVSHEAFAYLARAYGLTQVGISGLSPEAEPSPARMKEVADLVRSKGVSTVYYETLVDPKVAQTVADETGAATAVLDPLEGLTQGATGDYASIMATNLATLEAGQGCT
jgi:zinc transport system substrate-binding protein